MMKITVTNPFSGEVVEAPIKTDEQLVDAWKLAQSYEQLGKEIREQLKDRVRQIIGTKGVSDTCKGYQFRASSIQRYNYDKAVMREVLDEDTLDILLKPDKTAVDRYLKENLNQLGDASTVLRNNMITEGIPYEVIRLEKIA